MPALPSIQYFKRSQIDERAWNNCLDSSPNGVVYAKTYYLDAMADNWDGLVLGEYQAVMPLPWRRKYGIHYIYPPFLTAQLGVFSKNVDEYLFKNFLQSIPSRFLYWHLPLNAGNMYSMPYTYNLRANYILSLNTTYETLQSGYREHISRNIRRAEQYGLILASDISTDALLDLAAVQPHGPNTAQQAQIRALVQALDKRGEMKILGVNSARGELLSAALFAFSNGRAYYLLVGNHPNGRTLGASHLLIDGFIRQHAGSDLLLDFEGSDISSLAFFYSSFGAYEEKYPMLFHNHLPWYLRWAKK